MNIDKIYIPKLHGKTEEEIQYMVSSHYSFVCRVKEHNPIYDKFFSPGNGWIYVTNEIDFYSAMEFIEKKKRERSTFKHTIDYIPGNLN